MSATTKSRPLAPEWQQCRLGDLVTRLTNGYVGPTRNIYQDEGVPYLLARHVKSNRLTFDGKTFVTQAFNQKNKKSILKTGDVLLVQSGHVGHSAVVPPAHEGHNCHAMIVISPVAERISGRFLSLFFESPLTQAQFERIHTGATLKHLNCGDVKELRIPVPPLPEQQRIVGILDEAVEGIATAKANAEKNLQNARELFQSVLHRAIQGKLFRENANAAQAEDYYEHLNRGTSAVISEKEPPFEIPKSWQWTRLGHVADFINGDRGKNYPNRNEYVPTGLPFINTGHIQPDGGLSSELMNYITREKYDSLRSGKIKVGDLVYCLRGATIGKTAFVAPYTEGAVASSLVIIRPGRAIMSKYAYYFLTSPFGRGLIKRYDNGAAQPNLGANSVKKYVTPLPPLPEQTAIVEKLDALSTETQRLESIYQQKLDALEALKNSLLHQAFSGEL